MPDDNRLVRVGPVFIGALLVLVLQVGFALLGSAIGFSILAPGGTDAPSPSTIAWAAVIYEFVTLIISLFIGGYAITRMTTPQTRYVAGLYGVSIFAFVTLLMVFSVGLNFASLVGTFAARAGLGVGAVTAADSVMRDIGKMRIVTDLHLFKGKAVTEFITPEGYSNTPFKTALEKAEKTEKEISQGPVVKKDARHLVNAARKTTVAASGTALAALVLGALAGAWGGIRGAAAARPRNSIPQHRPTRKLGLASMKA